MEIQHFDILPKERTELFKLYHQNKKQVDYSNNLSVIPRCLSYLKSEFGKEFILMNINFYRWMDNIPPHHDRVGGYPIVVFTYYDVPDYTPRIFELSKGTRVLHSYLTQDGDVLINTRKIDSKYQHAIPSAETEHASIRASLVFGDEETI